MAKIELNFDPDQEARRLVEAALFDAMAKNSDKILKQIVHEVLEKKEKHGYASSYENGLSFLEQVIRGEIREAAQKAVAKWVEENKTPIEAMVAQEAALRLTPQFIATQVLDALQALKFEGYMSPKKAKASSIGEEEE